MHFSKILFCVAIAMGLVGCARPLVIAPDAQKIQMTSKSAPHKSVVGYYIANDLRDREVTTPGGGGDKVRYFPYRDIELGLHTMLGNVFSDVIRLKSADDTAAIGKYQVRFLVTPQVETNSSSASLFTWPPTNFTVALTCNITDAEGKILVSKQVIGTGQAEFDEFKSDFALSGKRAMQDALLKMQNVLLAARELAD